MIPMLKLIAMLIVMISACAAVFAADSSPATRGKYLVEEVAKCQLCHSPQTETGELDKTNLLKGATLNFQPMHEIEDWHKTAPDLTGGGRLMQRWGEDGLTKFLETGLGPRGNKADPPMPEYHLTHEDAVAIVQYLKSIE